MVILVVFKGFLLVKNLEILVQIVPASPIYYYFYVFRMLSGLLYKTHPNKLCKIFANKLCKTLVPDSLFSYISELQLSTSLNKGFRHIRSAKNFAKVLGVFTL